MTRLFAIVTVGVLLAAASVTAVMAESCVGCHQDPVYKKEDVKTLKSCLRCHGSAGHPYKEEASKGGFISLVSFAEGAEAAEAAATADAAKVIGEKPHPTSHPMTEYEGRSLLSEKAERAEKELRSMALIPEGEFIMGTDDRLRDERPTYVVYTDSFYIDRFEVTNADYSRFVRDTGHRPPDHWPDDWSDHLPVHFKEGGASEGKENHPVVYVDWSDANAYCAWAGKRLPREVEWEKAARGTDGRVYPWGSDWDLEKSNNPYKGADGAEGTMPVGSFEEGKSPYGLYDMSGNVWEWVDEFYLPHPGSDYVSPEFGTKHRLLKGGSWWDCMFFGCGISAPVYNRAFFDATTKNDSMGFRCAAGDR